MLTRMITSSKLWGRTPHAREYRDQYAIRCMRNEDNSYTICYTMASPKATSLYSFKLQHLRSQSSPTFVVCVPVVAGYGVPTMCGPDSRGAVEAGTLAGWPAAVPSAPGVCSDPATYVFACSMCGCAAVCAETRYSLPVCRALCAVDCTVDARFRVVEPSCAWLSNRD